MLNAIRIDKYKRNSDSNSERGCCGLARLLDEEVRCHTTTARRTVVPVHDNQDLKPGTQRGIMRDAGLTDADL